MNLIMLHQEKELDLLIENCPHTKCLIITTLNTRKKIVEKFVFFLVTIIGFSLFMKNCFVVIAYIEVKRSLKGVFWHETYHYRESPNEKWLFIEQRGKGKENAKIDQAELMTGLILGWDPNLQQEREAEENDHTAQVLAIHLAGN